MNKNLSNKGLATILIVLITMVVTVLVVGAGAYIGMKFGENKPKESVETKKQEGDKTVSSQQQELKASEIISIDTVWDRYANHSLGFSLKIPKMVVHPYGSPCKWSTANGDNSYRPTEGKVPVKVFEDGNDVYISTEYFYKMSGETKENFKTYCSKCDKVVNSVNLLRPKDIFPSIGWKFLVRSAKNDGELEAFIKDHYGTGCSLGDKKASKQEGIFDVSIKGDGLDLESTKCPLNYSTRLKYYPTKQKLISWDLGQAFTFVGEKDVTYDQEMADSFKFE